MPTTTPTCAGAGTARPLSLLVLTLLATGCASTGRLAEYDFRDRSLAVVNIAPPAPRIDTGEDLEIDPHDWGATAARVGAGIVKEGLAEGARARLDSASHALDTGARLSARLLALASRELRVRPTEVLEEADFELEVRIREYGIEADDWDSQARLYLRAEVRLMDPVTAGEIWAASVDESEALNEQAWGASPGGPLSSIITGGALARLSVDEMERTLAALADYAADRVADKLRKGLARARG